MTCKNKKVYKKEWQHPCPQEPMHQKFKKGQTAKMNYDVQVKSRKLYDARPTDRRIKLNTKWLWNLQNFNYLPEKVAEKI